LRVRPELERELHRRACETYGQDGDWEQAVRHAVAAADPRRAADLIWHVAPEYVSHGKTETLKRWVSWLRDADLAAHPQAALARGWAAFEEGDADLAAHCAAITLGADADRALADGERLHTLGLVLRAAIAAHGLHEAMDDAARGDAGLSPDNPLRGIALLVMGSGAMLHGETERARVLLGQAEQLAAGRLTTLYALALSQQALFAIENGRWDDADALMNRAWAFQRAVPIRNYSSQGLVSAVRALTLAHRREVTQARGEADRAARNLALRAVVPWLALETRLVIARARAELGDSAQAQSLLDESRSRIEQDGAPLLRAWAARVATALERLGGDAATGPALTTAELRTLQYLPTHLSFAEIGERLYVTRNTVKTHAISVYRKLDVSSRTEAVARGRELGLLER
jgi:LuxR family maltose regulon positive regulatory protein